VIPLGEALGLLDAGRPLPRGAVCITFDDGYLNNYEVAWPALRRHGLPATIFLTAGFIGTSIVLWPDRLAHALSTGRTDQVKVGDDVWPLTTPGDVGKAWSEICGRLKGLPEPRMQATLADVDAQCGTAQGEDLAFADSRLMDWEQAREMHASGSIEFGSHTMTHPILSRITEDRLRAELEDSRRIIEGELGSPCATLAYPNGGPEDVTDAVIECAKSVGYTHALTTTLGRAGVGMDRYRLPRVSAGVATPDDASFAFQVSGVRAWMMQRRQSLRG
jgi:peptidoglycan/xylan/chitin deacetylase (PgdA/CDA1 family)